MKRILLQTISLAFFLLLLISCGSSGGKEEIQKGPQEQVQKNLNKDTVSNIPASDGPTETMSVAEAKKFIAAADVNKGKLITVSGYPRGTTKPVDGEFKLFLSDKTGTGLPEENFACTFKEEMKEAVRTNKAGSLVKVTGNIAWYNGMVVLKNATLSE